MTSYNESQKLFYITFLENVSTSPRINMSLKELEQLFLMTALDISTPKSIPQMWKDYVKEKDGNIPDASVSEMLYMYLGSLDYTGSLRERMKAWFETEQTFGDVFSVLLEDNDTILLETGFKLDLNE